MLKAATTYNAAADHFDDIPLSFWRRHGTKAVELLAPEAGSRVLDVGCGTGASALPAAAAVGPGGRVVGIDIAENMLACARAKAMAEGLSNVSFACRDMTAPAGDLGHFDAVISVFSIFFVEDVAGQLGHLWQRLRPGGKLVVTVWAERALEPVASVFAEELRRLRPDLPTGQRPWEKLVDICALRRTFLMGGLEDPAVFPVSDQQPLASPDDWWTIAMGSGFRGEIDQLLPAEQEMLRRNATSRLLLMGVRAVETSVIHAVATKPARQ